MDEDKKNTIVVVEDDENVRYLLEYILSHDGYSVLVEADGHRVNALMGSIPPPDMVILDLKLPYMDGFQVYRQIRANPEWVEVPVMMLSGTSTELDVVRALDAGVVDFVTVPFQPAVLLARIRRHLRMTTAA